MARLYQTGFELNSNTSGMEWTTSSGGFSTTTTNARSGTYCGRANASASAPYIHVVFRTDTAADVYLRAYIYIASAPAANTTIMGYGDSSSFYGAKVRLNTDRTLSLTYNDGTLSATGSTTLATSTWYRVEMYYDETNNQATLRLDGTTEIAATAVDDIGGGGKAIFGVFNSTTADIYFDDIAINDTTGSYQNSWPGSGKIIHLNPDSAGDSSSWTGYVGSGANWERVDETTPNDATDGVRSRTTNEVDEYGLTASGIGSSDTVNVVAVGFRANRSTGTTSSTFNVRVKDSSGGTVSESATFTASTTTWRTNDTANGNAAPYPLVTYNRPGGSSWTSTYLDSAIIGVKTVSGSGDRYAQLSTIWASVDYTPSTGPTVNVSDSVTTSESTSVLVGGAGVTLSITLPVHLLDEAGDDLLDENGNPLYEEGTGDFVNVSESVSVSVQASTAPLSVNVSDTVTTTEVSSVFAPPVGGRSVQQFDSITTTESVVVAIQATTTPTVSVSDTVTTTESSSVVEKTEVNLYDQISYTEAIGIVIVSAGSLSISVSDTVSTSESKAIQPVTAVVVSDSTTISESVALGVPNPTINVSDTITTSESLDFLIPKLYIGVSDTVTATESSTVSAPPPGSTTIVTSDTVTPTESVEMLISNLTLNVSDSVTVTENRVVDNSRQVRVSDTATITESNNFYIGTFYINVSELILSSERTIVQKASGAGGLDTLTIELEATTTHFVIDAESQSMTINATSTDIDLSAGSNSVILEA